LTIVALLDALVDVLVPAVRVRARHTSIVVLVVPVVACFIASLDVSIAADGVAAGHGDARVGLVVVGIVALLDTVLHEPIPTVGELARDAAVRVEVVAVVTLLGAVELAITAGSIAVAVAVAVSIPVAVAIAVSVSVSVSVSVAISVTLGLSG
jgi:hypothetical protein